jgi:hypothetical protein
LSSLLTRDPKLSTSSSAVAALLEDIVIVLVLGRIGRRGTSTELVVCGCVGAHIVLDSRAIAVSRCNRYTRRNPIGTCKGNGNEVACGTASACGNGYEACGVGTGNGCRTASTCSGSGTPRWGATAGNNMAIYRKVTSSYKVGDSNAVIGSIYIKDVYSTGTVLDSEGGSAVGLIAGSYVAFVSNSQHCGGVIVKDGYATGRGAVANYKGCIGTAWGTRNTHSARRSIYVKECVTSAVLYCKGCSAVDGVLEQGLAAYDEAVVDEAGGGDGLVAASSVFGEVACVRKYSIDIEDPVVIIIGNNNVRYTARICRYRGPVGKGARSATF